MAFSVSVQLFILLNGLWFIYLEQKFVLSSYQSMQHGKHEKEQSQKRNMQWPIVEGWNMGKGKVNNGLDGLQGISCEKITKLNDLVGCRSRDLPDWGINECLIGWFRTLGKSSGHFGDSG